MSTSESCRPTSPRRSGTHWPGSRRNGRTRNREAKEIRCFSPERNPAMRLLWYALAGTVLALCMPGTVAAQGKPDKQPASVQIDLSKLPPELAQRVKEALAKAEAA